MDRSPSDKRAIVKEIYEFIKNNDITEFYQLTDYAFDNNADWFEILMDGHTMVFDAVIRSRRHSDSLAIKRLDKAKTDYVDKMAEQGVKVDKTTGEVIEDPPVSADQ